MPLVVAPDWASAPKKRTAPSPTSVRAFDMPGPVFSGGESAILWFTAFFYLTACLYPMWVIFSILWDQYVDLPLRLVRLLAAT